MAEFAHPGLDALRLKICLQSLYLVGNIRDSQQVLDRLARYPYFLFAGTRPEAVLKIVVIRRTERKHIGIGDVVIGNQQAVRGNHTSRAYEVHRHYRTAEGSAVHIVDIPRFQPESGVLHRAHKPVGKGSHHPHTLVRPQKGRHTEQEQKCKGQFLSHRLNIYRHFPEY